MSPTNYIDFDGPRSRLGQPQNPRIGLQWKGGPCVDTLCVCGKQWHRCDTEFMYHLECPACKRLYYVGDSVEMVEMNAEESAALRARVTKDSKGNVAYVPWLSMEESDNYAYEKQRDGTEKIICARCFTDPCECKCIGERNKELEEKLKIARGVLWAIFHADSPDLDKLLEAFVEIQKLAQEGWSRAI